MLCVDEISAVAGAVRQYERVARLNRRDKGLLPTTGLLVTIPIMLPTTGRAGERRPMRRGTPSRKRTRRSRPEPSAARFL